MRALAVFILIATTIGVLLQFQDSFRFRRNPLPVGTQESGVVFFDHWRAQAGYNIINTYAEHAECKVVDMHGRGVYEFPMGFCYFFKNGDVLIAAGSGMIQYFDATAQITWQRPANVHHDIDVSSDEQEIFFVVDKFLDGADRRRIRRHGLIGLSRSGEQIFSWMADDHLSEISRAIGRSVKTGAMDSYEESFHLNSVQVLAANPLEKRDPAFTRGNILVNCFKNGVAFIIDRKTSKIVWSLAVENKYHPETGVTFLHRGFHTVKLLEDGRMLLFDNTQGYKDAGVAFSSIIEIDPIEKRTVWHYEASPVTGFWSDMWGSTYRLANGNTLISNSTAGSAFEVTPTGRIVWEWVNPDLDIFGTPGLVYRVQRVPKKLMDPIISIWKKFK